ncbi:uncharacterized protein LOC134241427 [Saccostrea cucullata]|uniref:uncharacterized protein LOC134241427 n=1 Tax=Saccostrea cuccullata TaxID=36930 RepID=UPI002ED49210
MLFVLYTLELLHLCNCGCQIGLPIKQELDRYSKSTIGTGHAFKVLSTSDLWTCLDLCSRFSMCRSVDLNRDQQTCRLNVRSAVEEPELLMASSDTSHIPKEDFLAIVNDGCFHHSCENMSMCLGGICVPIFDLLTSQIHEL